MLKKKTKALLVVSFFAYVSCLVGIVSAQTSLPPATFQLSPFSATLTKYHVYDAGITNAELTPPAGLSGASGYHDPSGRYPDVNCYVSQPFFTDPYGSDFLTAQEYSTYLADPATTVDYTFENGEHRFLKTINIAVDVVTRTYSNFAPKVYGTYYVSPLVGLSHFGYQNVFAKHRDGEVANQDVVEQPLGVLLANLDTGTSPWRLTWELGANEETKAKITTSLEDFRDATQMDYNLKHNYGNSPVKVIPEIQLNAIEDFVFYNYYQVIDGKAFHIETTDTKMAIIDANLALNRVGKVSNYIAPSEFQAQMPTEFDEKPTFSDEDPATSELAPKYSTQSTRTATFEYVQTIEDEAPSTGDIRPPQEITDNAIYPSSLNLAEFETLRTSVKASYEVRMQPFTWVKYAQYHAKYCGYAWAGIGYGFLWLSGYGTAYEGDLYPTFPYYLTTQNVYSIQRVVYTVLLATTNKVEYISATGQPERVEDIYDYGVSSAGFFNPTFDILKGSTTSFITPNPFEAWWQQNQASVITIITLVVVGIVAIGVIVGITKIQPRQAPPRQA